MSGGWLILLLLFGAPALAALVLAVALITGRSDASIPNAPKEPKG